MKNQKTVTIQISKEQARLFVAQGYCMHCVPITDGCRFFPSRLPYAAVWLDDGETPYAEVGKPVVLVYPPESFSAAAQTIYIDLRYTTQEIAILFCTPFEVVT